MFLRNYLSDKILSDFDKLEIETWKEATYKHFTEVVKKEHFTEIGFVKTIRAHYHIENISEKEIKITVLSGVWINLDKTRKNKDIKEDEIYLFYLKSSAKINMDKLSDFFIKNCDLSLFEESEFSKKELINLVLRYIKVEHIKWKHKEENCKMTTTVKKAILNYLKSG